MEVDEMGVDKMGVDKTGVDKTGVDEMGVNPYHMRWGLCVKDVGILHSGLEVSDGSGSCMVWFAKTQEGCKVTLAMHSPL